jgi:Holliday junction resolvasome RuvABC DNA-binding subunit
MGGSSAKQDAMDALLALGYGRAEAMQAVLEIAEEGKTADEIIRGALKKLSI